VVYLNLPVSLKVATTHTAPEEVRLHCNTPLCSLESSNQLARILNTNREQCVQLATEDLATTRVAVTRLVNACKRDTLGTAGTGFPTLHPRDAVFQSGLPCRTHADCPPGILCSLVDGHCAMPPRAQVRRYLECVLSQLADRHPAVFQHISAHVSLLDVSNFTDVVERTLDHFSVGRPACEGVQDLALAARTHAYMGKKFPREDIKDLISCKYWVSLDALFLQHTDYCIRGVRGQPTIWSIEEATQSCDMRFCNWRNCTGLTQQECVDLCASGPSSFFCGVCSDHTDQCIAIPDVQSEEQCLKGVGCLLANATAVLTNTTEECVALASCSQPCYDAPTCAPSGAWRVACADMAVGNETECTRLGGTWDLLGHMCVVMQSRDDALQCPAAAL